MTISQYGRAVTASAILFLMALFAISQARADTFWARDISVSNILARPTPNGADIAHVALVVSNTASENDALIAVEVSPQIAAYAGFDALPTSVYRGATLQRSQPVFFAAGQTKTLGLDGLHLVLYGIQGPFIHGMGISARLTFEKAGTVDVVVEVSREPGGTASSAGIQRTIFWSVEDQAQPLREAAPGAAFACQDGSKLVLSFQNEIDGFSAVVSVGGASYRLPILAPEPGPVQIVWSDGQHSLTWSPGVQLMWMSGSTHLMCGRGGHKH
jgi:copper(I)-binding protein